MASVWSLMAMILWGILLGFCYQVFLRQTERFRSLGGLILLYLFAGVLCFLITALFLYGINGGKWGIYGFLSMVLGFFLYYQWMRPAGNKISAYADHVVTRTGNAVSLFGKKVPGVLLYPFEKMVDKGEKWIGKKEEKRGEKRKKEDPGKEKLL
ncbi:MAG: spore cortex biosynthesis protein YabQ [Clostridia bacterium]